MKYDIFRSAQRALQSRTSSNVCTVIQSFNVIRDYEKLFTIRTFRDFHFRPHIEGGLTKKESSHWMLKSLASHLDVFGANYFTLPCPKALQVVFYICFERTGELYKQNYLVCGAHSQKTLPREHKR